MEKLHSSSLVSEHWRVSPRAEGFSLMYVLAFLCVLMESWNGVHFLLSLKRIVKGKTDSMSKKDLWYFEILCFWVLSEEFPFAAGESLEPQQEITARAGEVACCGKHEDPNYKPPNTCKAKWGDTCLQAQCYCGEMVCEDKRFSLEVCGPTLLWHMHQETLSEIRFRMGT